jgi:hypothetical protein
MAVFSVGLAGSLYTLVQYGLVSLRWCCVVVLFCCFCCFVGPSVGAGWSSGLMRESDLRGLALERWSRLISTMSRGRVCLEVSSGKLRTECGHPSKCDCSISTPVMWGPAAPDLPAYSTSNPRPISHHTPSPSVSDVFGEKSSP